MFPRFALLAVLSAFPVFSGEWNSRLAADYLDSRQKEWFAWPTANSSGAPCVSCHTGVTYLFARPALRRAAGEKERTPFEKGLVDSLRSRVAKKTAAEIAPRSKEPNASQSLGVETVLAALFLAREDAGSGKLGPDAQLAFDRLWALQLREGTNRGAWNWFSLNLDPWEMPESPFYGASLAAMAVGSAPESYRKLPEVKERVAELVTYLGREQESQPLHNRAMLLWAASVLPEAASKAVRRSIAEAIWQKQQSDGGWTIESLGPWQPHPNAPAVEPGSNSYATALMAFVVQQAGAGRSHAGLKRALDWLRTRQDAQAGYWPAASMNKEYQADSMMVRFMQDAATAYATMALLN
jgi:squalene-hopene/tetraprenyl-beta-curcumene cyclase